MINKRIILFLNRLIEDKNLLELELEFLLSNEDCGYLKFNEDLNQILNKIIFIDSKIDLINKYVIIDNVINNNIDNNQTKDNE